MADYVIENNTLSSEQILQLIAEVLTSKTDSNTNSNMKYTTVSRTNKGLNPDYFGTGYNTKIVNAINMAFAEALSATDSVTDFGAKINNILLDTDVPENAMIWEKVQAMMGQDTLIEGIESLLEGNLAQQVLGLGLSDSDVGKFLTVEKNEDTHNLQLTMKELPLGTTGTVDYATKDEIKDMLSDLGIYS